jgi:hypothetical protein
MDADFQSQDVKTFRQWLLDELGGAAQPQQQAKTAAENRLIPSRGNVLEHDPEKWKPVFGKDHASTQYPDHDPVQLDRIMV